ncbi:syntaxin-binding protein 4-like [Ruditapes philippinarum]|uniref:syntaxin-binding protein 4-like n=1 Tax=Ruditapes philippinarum TaxID=129788 RepID=UPI00295A5924|nr:syntaxin-binding protein 4-like [Ruditapes philippinarum]
MSSTLVITQTAETDQNYAGAQEEVEEEVPPREAELFEFDNCSKGLGIKICGGCSLDGEELNGVFIKRVLPGGLAEAQGGLKRGDQILEVNGDSLEGVTNDRAVSILRQACASNHVEIVVSRDEQAIKEFKEILEKTANCSVPGTPVPSEQSRKTSVVRSENGASNRPEPETVTPNTQEGQTPPVAQDSPNTPVNSSVMPKLAFRGLIPSMASTPHQKGSTATVGSGSSGSRFSSFPNVEPSPVGVPVSLSDTFMSSGSVFEPNTNEPPHQRQSHATSLTRKLSIDPYVRLKVEKLNAALRYLGLDPTPEKEFQMRSQLNIDSRETVHYGEFVEVVREVFKSELAGKNIGTSTMMFAASDITDLVEPPAFRSEMNGGASGVSQPELELENEELRQENMRLQVLLREKEDEVLRIRKEAQGAIQEQRELRSKVHLAAKAQQVARDMEHDYEEVVRLLEGEIAQLKLQLGRQSEGDPIMQRRLAVLTCQLRKAESEKETFKVATEKLLQFAEGVHEMTSENGAASRPLAGAKSTGVLGKHKRSTKSIKTMSTEAKDIVKSVRSLIDTQPLPFGWEETYTSDGMRYYINHLNQVTTWTHPLSNVTHLPSVQDDKKSKGEEPQPSGSQS